MSDYWAGIVACIIFNIVVVMIISIKERKNIITSIVDFFKEWRNYLKIVAIPLLIVIILLLGWFGT